MNCPNCNAPNLPEAKICVSCGCVLSPQRDERRRKSSGVIRALLIAAIVPMFYYLSMYAVSMAWMLRFAMDVPSGITAGEFNALYTEAFNRDSAYINILAVCIVILAATFFCLLKKRSLIEAANVRAVSPVKTASAFVCGLTAQIPIGIVVALIPFSDAVTENYSSLANAATAPVWVQLLYGVVIAPIAEEMMFRGIVHDRLSRVMSVSLAAMFSSIGFALMHGELISSLVAFCVGFALALIYSRFKTCLIPIAFHMGFNLLSFAVGYITDPLILFAAGAASVGLFIVSLYLLFRKDETEI